MDPTQLLLSITLSVTTLFLVVVGIQLILLLRQLRKVVSKANSIIGELEKTGMKFNNGFSEIIGFFSGLKTIFKVINTVQKKKNE